VVTICSSCFNYEFCRHSVFICSVWFLQMTVSISLSSINRLGFVMEAQCGFCEKWVINGAGVKPCRAPSGVHVESVSSGSLPVHGGWTRFLQIIFPDSCRANCVRCRDHSQHRCELIGRLEWLAIGWIILIDCILLFVMICGTLPRTQQIFQKKPNWFIYIGFI
jgi:hypothetical protein